MFDVHLYAVVRVKVADVEAPSMETAIERARAEADLDGMFATDTTQWAEEIVYAVVDVQGDEEYEQSKWFSFDPVSDSPVEGNPGMARRAHRETKTAHDYYEETGDERLRTVM